MLSKNNRINLTRWFMAVFVVLLTSQIFGHGMSDEEKQLIIDGGNLRYIWIGATHMLSGYDHLAFVFGIIFFLTKFTDIVKYITAFTLGHSITLIFATFNAIQVNYFLIDAVIALSVCYIAFHNLDGFNKYLKVKSPNMLAMILGLGLIHGLGLSTRLQQLPLSEDHLLMNIISFNVGIEIGQIAALTVMLVFIAAFRKSAAFASFSLIANYFLVFAGFCLFLMQMHGYAHTANPEEFAANVESVDAINTTEVAAETVWTDTITIDMPARGELEYKIFMQKDAVLEYQWDSDKGELFYDFHGEPRGDTTGYFKSYDTNTLARSSGSLSVPFEGTHGWYWSNKQSEPVVITLRIRGDYERIDLEPESE